MRKIKKTIAIIVSLVIITNVFPKNIYANSLNQTITSENDVNIPDTEKAKLAGEYLGQIMEIILKNYVGDPITAEQLYEAAISGMTDQLDVYSQYFDKKSYNNFSDFLDGKIHGYGIMFDKNKNNDTIISEVIANSPAGIAGIKANDIVIKMNNINIRNKSIEEISKIIKADESEKANITILRDGKTIGLAMTKADVIFNSVHEKDISEIVKINKDYNLDKTKYILLDGFLSDTDEEFEVIINKYKKQGIEDLIIDLRGNPGGSMETVINMSQLIVPKGPILYTVDSKGKKEKIESSLEKPPFKRIVILTDENTASAAEVLTGALQDSKVGTVIGNTTFGKGVIQAVIDMPLEGALKLTIQEYLTRNENKINKVGIKPDIFVTHPDYLYDAVNLDENKKNDNLIQVKKILKYTGYKIGNTNNIFDEDTLKAVLQVQKNAKLMPTGLLDAETIVAIDKEMYEKYTKVDLVLQSAYDFLSEK